MVPEPIDASGAHNGAIALGLNVVFVSVLERIDVRRSPASCASPDVAKSHVNQIVANLLFDYPSPPVHADHFIPSISFLRYSHLNTFEFNLILKVVDTHDRLCSVRKSEIAQFEDF
jgi:hypothetical protein